MHSRNCDSSLCRSPHGCGLRFCGLRRVSVATEHRTVAEVVDPAAPALSEQRQRARVHADDVILTVGTGPGRRAVSPAMPSIGLRVTALAVPLHLVVRDGLSADGVVRPGTHHTIGRQTESLQGVPQHRLDLPTILTPGRRLSRRSFDGGKGQRCRTRSARTPHPLVLRCPSPGRTGPWWPPRIPQ